MSFTVDAKKFFYSLRLIGIVTATWPLKTNPSTTEKLVHGIIWWITCTNNTLLLISLILGIYYFRNESVQMMKTLTEFTALMEFFINVIQCKMNKHNLQIVLDEIEYFVENADEFERKLLQKYIDKNKNFQFFVGLSFMVTALMFMFTPILTSQLLPADAWYPFSVKPIFIRVFLFFSQVVAIIQVGLGFTVDVTVATMLWYSALQIELLAKKIIKAIDIKELKDCARRHHELVEFTKNVMNGVRFIILKTNVTMIIVISSAAVQLIHHQPLEVLLRFILLVEAGCFKLYVSAKAADDLKENSENLAQSAVENAVSQKSQSAAKLGLMMASRFQKPMILSVNGIIKAYTLQHYASFLSTTMGYFLNLRVIYSKFEAME